MGMTNEEAIDYFKKCNENLVSVAKDENVYNYEKKKIEADCMRKAFEANEKAIQALEQQPNYLEQIKWERDIAIEQLEQLGYSLGEKIKTDGDCISREQAVYVASGYCAPQNIADELRKLPSVTPQPKSGEWKYVTHYARRYRVCSECNAEKEDDRATGWNFCPHCGALMNGGEE